MRTYAVDEDLLSVYNFEIVEVDRLYLVGYFGQLSSRNVEEAGAVLAPEESDRIQPGDDCQFWSADSD